MTSVMGQPQNQPPNTADVTPASSTPQTGAIDPNTLPDSTKVAAAFLGILSGDTYQKIHPPPAFSVGDLEASGQQYMQPIAAQQQGSQATTTTAPGAGDWRVDVLNRIGAPVTDQNLHVLQLWQRAEGGGADGPSHTDFNWLNTTRTASDAPYTAVINSVGVKKYASYEAGINATVGALTNGYYQSVLDALRKGDNEFAVANAIAGSQWGTGSGVLNLLNAEGPFGASASGGGSRTNVR